MPGPQRESGGGGGEHAFKNKQTKINDANYYYYFSKYHLRNARWSLNVVKMLYKSIKFIIIIIINCIIIITTSYLLNYYYYIRNYYTIIIYCYKII